MLREYLNATPVPAAAAAPSQELIDLCELDCAELVRPAAQILRQLDALIPTPQLPPVLAGRREIVSALAALMDETIDLDVRLNALLGSNFAEKIRATASKQLNTIFSASVLDLQILALKQAAAAGAAVDFPAKFQAACARLSLPIPPQEHELALKLDDLTRCANGNVASMIKAVTSAETESVQIIFECMRRLAVQLQLLLFGPALRARNGPRLIQACTIQALRGRLGITSDDSESEEEEEEEKMVSGKKRVRLTAWTAEEDDALRRGVEAHGTQWTRILLDKEFTFAPARHPTALKDRWRVIHNKS